MPHISKIFDQQEKNFSIRFSEYFDLSEVENPERYETFNLGKKRVFQSICGLICEDLEFYFRTHEDLITAYFSARQEIEDSEEMSQDDFIELVAANIIRDPALQHAIRDRVNREYTITIETKNGEDELQFKDSYAKLLVCIASMCRLVAPFVCVYMDKYEIKKEQDLSLRLFTEVFKVFDVDEFGETVDLSSKINRFIASTVENTLYSDRVVWKYLENVSMTDRLLTIDLFRKVVRDTIPKMVVDRSVVSFLYVVVKQQILFTFTQNIKITFKPISPIKTEGGDGSVSTFTRMEMRLVSANEMNYVIEKEAIRGFIEKHRLRFRPEEFEYYSQVVQPNTLQLRLVSYFVNGLEKVNIHLCNRDEYVWMVMIAHKFFIQKNFRIIASLILARPTPKENKRSMNRNKLISDIVQSKSYQQLLSRFPLVERRLGDARVLIGLIGDVMNTTFEAVPAFGENAEDVAHELIDTDTNQKNIMQEILSFLLRF